MRTADVMTTSVITAGPKSTVQEIAALLLEKRISAVPIVEDGKLLGIVSEGDLIRRSDIGTEVHRSWWLTLFSQDSRTADYVKSRGRHADDVMTRELVTVSPEMDIAEVAATLEKHNVKRVPVVDEGKMVGIVSRANLLPALTKVAPLPEVSASDQEIRSALINEFGEAGLERHLLRVSVKDGLASITGAVRTPAQMKAVRVAVENVAGIKAVEEAISVVPDTVLPGY